jgi:hypothetical protein
MGRGLTPLLSITGFERVEPFGFERAKPFLSLGGKTPCETPLPTRLFKRIFHKLGGEFCGGSKRICNKLYCSNLVLVGIEIGIEIIVDFVVEFGNSYIFISIKKIN